MSDVTWISEVVEHDVRERRIDLTVDDHIVPALIWTPAGSSGPRPLVLVGHGGTRNKRAEYVLALARSLVRHHGWAVVCIDAPGHGDRLGAENLASFQLDPETGRERARMAVSDWKATLDAVQTFEDVGAGAVGWWGLSMGTVLGVPFVAREQRVTVAVFGLAGAGGDRRPGFAELAARITVPILFIVQLEDELVGREGALALFDAFASTDKRLHANPGAHAAVPAEEMDASEAFLAKHLTPAKVPV
jgi:dienelactone hydrolase